MIRLSVVRTMHVCAILIALVAATAASTAFAQNTSAEDQLRILQNLPPEQQETLLQQLEQQGGGTAGPASGIAESRRDTVPTERPRATEQPQSPDVLRPDDLVVIELALPGTMSKGSVRSSTVEDPNAETAPRRVRPETDLDEGTKIRLERIIATVRTNSAYRLDRIGQLNLPGFNPILLGGLTERQAVALLSAESSLQELDVSLQRMPVNKIGVEGLKPFGYDLFGENANFTAVADTPVSPDYVVRPGDRLNVQLFGSQNRSFPLSVSREGTVNFPELGPIRVGGLRFSQIRSIIENRVTRELLGVRVDVSMGDMRSITVTVVGEVRQVGNHVVGGLATITSALLAAGGITKNGSLRNIELKRQGQLVRRLDLYDLRINGNNGDDAKLQDGDVILVNVVGPQVSVDGEVRRPAIYELRGTTTASEVLQMAGGFTPQADPSRSSAVRVDEQFRHVVIDLDFTSAGANTALRNGDELQVARLRPQMDSGVVLEGFVHRQGFRAWRPGLRLSDVIPSIDELQPGADPNYILIRRESGPDRQIQALSTMLVAALAQRGGPADLELQPRDRIKVFDFAPGRDRIIKSFLLDDLRLQSSLSRPTEVVSVEGKVKLPGEFPLEPGMTISDLIRAGGSLDAAAYGGKAELVRYKVGGDGALQTELVEVDLAAVLRGDPQADLLLRSLDNLLIRQTPDWDEQESVTLRGEVSFPGKMRIRRGETLYEVLQRAGNLTSRAFMKGSVFTRVYLRENEEKQKERQVEQLQSDLAAMALQAAAANQSGAGQTLTSGQSVLAQLQGAKPVGRMVIDLEGLMAAGKGSSKDIVLRDGDVLMVPQVREEVTVIGEVPNPTSHHFKAGQTRDEYLALSGNTTRKADKRRIYVVRADGSTVNSSGSWLRRDFKVAIQPGDTIVVPLNTEKLPKLPFWQAVTGIIYNLAVSVAAISSF